MLWKLIEILFKYLLSISEKWRSIETFKTDVNLILLFNI